MQCWFLESIGNGRGTRYRLLFLEKDESKPQKDESKLKKDESKPQKMKANWRRMKVRNICVMRICRG